tara:strand:- start:31 stop:378 length:348 start_codon:yes stop_codon:yes gene_type:complete
MPRLKLSEKFDVDFAEKILCGISDEVDKDNIPEWIEDFREWIFWEASKEDKNYVSEDDVSSEDYNSDEDVNEQIIITKDDEFWEMDDVITKEVIKNEVIRKKKIIHIDIDEHTKQ